MILISRNDENTIINLGEYNPVEDDDIQFTEQQYIYYSKSQRKYILHTKKLQDNEDTVYIGRINYYVLLQLIKKNNYLGDKPGMDIYRYNRLLTVENPISGRGDMLSLIEQGGMRGKRCHITFYFEDINISDNLTVDGDMGVSSMKTVGSKKIHKSLVKCFEDIARLCNKKYENLGEEMKKDLTVYLNSMKEETSFSKLKDNIKKLENFEEYQSYYRVGRQFCFCSSSDNEVYEKKEKKIQKSINLLLISCYHC